MKFLQINNFASHYRSFIFQLIEREFGADFVFGDRMGDLRAMDYSLLSNHVTVVHNVFLKHCYYQKGVLSFLRRDYDTYLMTGEFRCITTWLLLICIKLMPSKKAYLWTHGWLGKEKGLKRLITKLFFCLADGIFVYNNRSRQLMIEGGIASRKLTTIYNSLDYDTQLAIRKTLKPSDIYETHFCNSHRTLIFIGRLTRVKRLEWLMEALYILSNRGKKYNLVLIGDGADRERLEKMARDKGLSSAVWFYGVSYDEQKNAEFIFNADICVSPGNVGLTAIHAMMYGCPVITNDDFDHQMPEFEAIQKGKTGDFFHAGDVDSLADTISCWFKSQDYQRESVRQACYQEIDSKWTPEHQLSILKSVLRKK